MSDLDLNSTQGAGSGNESATGPTSGTSDRRGATAPPRSEETASSTRFAWLNTENAKWAKENAKSALALFLNSLIFLVPTAAMAATMYVSVLAMPVIAAGLSGALGLLGLPQAVITFLAILPIIASAAIFLRFLQIHWEMYQHFEESLKDFVLLVTITNPVSYFTFLIQRALFLNVDLPGTEKVIDFKPAAKKGELVVLREIELVESDNDEENTNKNDQAKKWQKRFWYYHIFAGLAALGLGGYLVSQIVPALLPVVMSLGVPFPVAVLFGAMAAATLIAITYQLLAAVVTLRNLYLTKGMLWKDESKTAPLNYHTLALVAVGGLGILVSAGAAYLFFTPLVNALAPVLTQGLAIFTAVAVSVSLALLMMRLLPEVADAVIQAPGKAKEVYGDFQKQRTKTAANKSEVPLLPKKRPSDAEPAEGLTPPTAQASGFARMIPSCLRSSTVDSDAPKQSMS